MIITLTGPAGAGKDTVADYLVKNHGFVKVSWATPLKRALASMGFPEPANREDKEKLIEGYPFSWRQAAQRLGTEFGRALDPDIWVKQLITHLEQQPNMRWVISDTRFENEAARVRAAGGKVVHITGRKADLGAAAGHASEVGVPKEAGDYLLGNHADIETLLRHAEQMVQYMFEREASK